MRAASSLLFACLVFVVASWARSVGAAPGPFEASPEMRAWAEGVTRDCRGPQARLDCLQQALFSAEFGFTYDGARSTTAAETFAQRRGNCFGFTAMFLSLSRAIYVRTELVQVPSVRDARQDLGLVVVSRHLAVVWRSGPERVFYDFGQQGGPSYRGAIPVSDARGEAMYHNNRSLALLRSGEDSAALAALERALAADPTWADPWVNIGVMLRRRGDLRGAYQAYLRALELDPAHASALSNLAWLYAHAGDLDARHRALVDAAQASEVTVFTLLSLAHLEQARGDHSAARRALRRARLIRPGTPEVHEALAWWARLEGDRERAERHSRQATRLRKGARSAPDQGASPAPSSASSTLGSFGSSL